MWYLFCPRHSATVLLLRLLYCEKHKNRYIHAADVLHFSTKDSAHYDGLTIFLSQTLNTLNLENTPFFGLVMMNIWFGKNEMDEKVTAASLRIEYTSFLLAKNPF